MGGERVGEPVASDLLRGPVVVRGHDGIGRGAVGEGRGRVCGETLDANSVIVDDAAGERDEAGEGKRAHRIGPPATAPSLSSHFSPAPTTGSGVARGGQPR